MIMTLSAKRGNLYLPVFLLVVVAVFLQSSIAVAQAELVFRDTVFVSGTHVLLSDVAEIITEDSEIASDLNEVLISTIPPVNIPLHVDRRLVDYKLQQRRIAGVSFSGSEQTVVFTKTVTIKGRELTEKARTFLEEKLQAVNLEKEIHFPRIPSDITAPESEISLEVIQKKFGRLKGSFLVNIGVYTDGKLYRNVPVSVKVRTFEPVVTALRRISQGELITKDNVQLSFEETTGYNYDLVSNIALVAGKRTKLSISEGKPVLLKNIEDPPLVKKGDQVTIEVTRGGISISCSGTAVEEGRLGELIRVRRDDSNIEYRAKVKSASSVVID